MPSTKRSPRRRSPQPGSGPRQRPSRSSLSREALLELEILEELAERGYQARTELRVRYRRGYTDAETHNALRRLKRAGHVTTRGRGAHATWRLVLPGLWRGYDRWVS